MMNILTWIVFGFLAGVIATFLKPDSDLKGWLVTIIIGILGSVVGGFLGKLIFGADVTNEVFSFYSMGMSVIGTIIILYTFNAIAKKA